VPAVAIGTDARAALAKTRGALKNANARIRCGADWYDAVAAEYRGEPHGQEFDATLCVEQELEVQK